MDYKLIVSALLLALLAGCGPQQEPATQTAAPAVEPSAPAPAAPAPAADLAVAAPQPAAAPAAAKAAPTPTVPVPAAPAPAAATAKATTASAADLSAGQAKYKTMCAGCHGPKAEGIATYPKLAGQSAEGLMDKLAKYRAGEKIGPMSGAMMPIARMLTEAEVKQVSDYLSSL